MTTPDRIAPTLPGEDAPIEPDLCRLSPDGLSVAFWVPQANPPGLFVADVGPNEPVGLSSKRVFSPQAGHLAELAWSGDGQWLAFTLSDGPPPGQVRVVALRLSNPQRIELPGMAFAWAGSAATLLIADPRAARLYLKDLELEVEHRLCDMTDDGDPHFPPVLSVSPDQRRFALVTRRVGDEVTRVLLAHHDGRQWETRPLTDVPGTGLRVLPFWSFDSHSLALYVIDLERHATSMVALPQRDGPGTVLYSSESIDGQVTPAVHPDGRLIAMLRSNAVEAGASPESHVALVDPVERSAALLSEDAEKVNHLRWIDAQTLLVEGRRAVWTIRLRATEEAPPQAPEVEPAPATPGYTRTIVRDEVPRFTLVCEIPEDWKRLALPGEAADFNDPRVMRPLCVFAPPDAPIVFTVATRPVVPGATSAAALGFLARVQGFEVGEIQTITLPCGQGAQTFATQTMGEDSLKMRLVMIEDGGHFFSLATMAPAPLWDALEPILNHIIDSFALLDPRGPTTPPLDSPAPPGDAPATGG
jgi:hypothetical protein